MGVAAWGGQPSGGSLATVATYAYSATAQDRLSTITTSAGTTTYGYSSDGDTTSYGTNTLTWNGNGKIASDAPTSSSSVAYTYDPLGRLQTRTTTGPSATNHYIYTGTSDTPIMVTDGSGTITESYIGGPLGTRRMIAGPPLDADGGGPSATSTFLMPDCLGNQAATLNDTGTRTNTYTYDAFGTPNDATPTNTLTNRFLAKNGRPLDTLSGLVLMGARLYDSTTGRFLTTDPIEGGSASLYDYVDQNPLNAFDPNGTSCWLCNITSAKKKLMKIGLKALNRIPARAADDLVNSAVSGVKHSLNIPALTKAVVHLVPESAWESPTADFLVKYGAKAVKVGGPASVFVGLLASPDSTDCGKGEQCG